MKKLYLTFFVANILGSATLNAQTTYQVGVMEKIDINNMSVPILSDGALFWNNNHSNPITQKVPKNGANGTLFAGSIWIGGKDSSNQLYMMADRYRQKYGTNLPVDQQMFFGPVATNYNTLYDATYNSVWKITASEILYHRLNFNNTAYTIPNSISSWPAHGNLQNGEAANLAPYVDVNNNNTYDPQNGDYPAIRGDQALYFITNDSRLQKTPLTPAMGIEVHGMAYAFNKPNNPALNNNIFINYKVINRSNLNFQDVRIGMWTDFDIGNFNNDYIGTLVDKNAFYAFNGTDHDSTDLSTSPVPLVIQGYGTQPPAQGVMFLGGPQLSSFIFYNSDITARGNPQTPQDYYNYMKATWRDGTPVTFGGHGKNDITNKAYKFMFPGNSDPNGTGYVAGPAPVPFAWEEFNRDAAGSMNVPGDRRGIGAFTVSNLNSGDSYCFDVAFPFAQGNDRLHSVQLMEQYMQEITDFYNTHFPNACDLKIVASAKSTLTQNLNASVFPNPANDKLMITLPELPAGQTTLTLFDLSGKKVLMQNLQSDQNSNFQIDIAAIPAGMYLVQVEHGSLTKREKLLIAR